MLPRCLFLHALLALLCILVMPCATIGQLNKPIQDSLRNVLSRPLSDVDRLSPLSEMAWTHLFTGKAMPYLNELDSLTASLAAHPDSATRAKALGYRSRMFYQRGYHSKFRRDMAAAQRDFREAIRVGRENHDTLNVANGLSALGVTFLALRMPVQALHYFEEELQLILSTAEKPTMYLTDIRRHKADALMQLGRLEEARTELLQCDTLDPARHATTLMGLGQLEACKGDTSAAIEIMTHAQQVVADCWERWNHIPVLEPLARLQLQAGRVNDALATSAKAIAVARELDDDAALAGCLIIAGEASLRNNDQRGAERMFEEAMDIARRNGFVGLSRETGDDGSMVRAAELLKELYKRQGRTADALVMTEQWTTWKDSIHRIEGQEELLRFELQSAQVTDSIANAERVLAATNGLRTELEQERTRRNLALVVGAAVFFLALLASFVFINRRRLERQLARHEQERSEQERMINELRMREMMSEDLHEELGAGLSALKLWSDMDLAEESDPRRRKLLESRIAMANELVASLRQIIWALNSPTTTVKQLVDYLVDYSHLHCAQHELRLHAECDTDWPAITLRPEQRRNPFLAVKETLNNTVKHSGADRVELHITNESGIVIDLRDNGKGSSTAPDQLPGNGLRNMKRRITAIGGSVVADGSKGMRVLIRIPFNGGN